MPRASMG